MDRLWRMLLNDETIKEIGIQPLREAADRQQQAIDSRRLGDARYLDVCLSVCPALMAKPSPHLEKCQGKKGHSKAHQASFKLTD